MKGLNRAASVGQIIQLTLFFPLSWTMYIVVVSIAAIHGIYTAVTVLHPFLVACGLNAPLLFLLLCCSSRRKTIFLLQLHSFIFHHFSRAGVLYLQLLLFVLDELLE